MHFRLVLIASSVVHKYIIAYEIAKLYVQNQFLNWKKRLFRQ